WAADYLALVCAAQVALLLLAGGLRPLEGARDRPAAGRAGLGLLVLGVLVYPLAGLVLGWPGLQAETFGLMPEPTALATMGGLLAFAALRRAWLWPIPLASLCVGLATRSLLWAS
ncbi:MAG TPA: hypothetical protein VLI46_10630, partial [Ramlibacter sp.]|nr:hypothetical protein [Ramlibacter sp.]